MQKYRIPFRLVTASAVAGLLASGCSGGGETVQDVTEAAAAVVESGTDGEAVAATADGPPPVDASVDLDGCAWPVTGMFGDPDMAEPDPQLCLTMELSTAELRPGEDLLARLHVENRGDEPIKTEIRGICPAFLGLYEVEDRELLAELAHAQHGPIGCGGGDGALKTYVYPPGETTIREVTWPLGCQFYEAVDQGVAHFGEFIVGMGVATRSDGVLFAMPATFTLVDDPVNC